MENLAQKHQRARKIAEKKKKTEQLTDSSLDVEGLLVKRTERVAMKRRENMAEMKIRKEKRPRKVDPPLDPLVATAIGF